jgi:signal peptidase I
MKKKSLSIVVTVLLILSTILCFFIIIQAALNQSVSLFGYHFFYVTTGSMEPNIPVGSVVVTHRSKEQYEKGDVITFTSRDSAIYGRPNTHRIVGIEQSGAEVSYITRGDANSSPDNNPVPASDVIGKVILSFTAAPIRGLFSVLETKFGFVLLILVPLMLITVGCIKDFSHEYKEQLKSMEKELRQMQSQENQKDGKE